MNFGTILNNAMEAISFQSGAFGLELETHFQALNDRKIKNSEAMKSPEKRLIEESIKTHTGIKVRLEFVDSGLAYTYPIIPNISSVLLADGWGEVYKDSIDNILKASKKYGKETTIDLKKGYVTGLLSEIEAKICLDLRELVNSKLSVQEIVAITLHELGHNFTAIEFANRSIRTNQALILVSRSLMSSQTVEQKKLILKEASEIIGLKKEELVSYSEVTEPDIMVEVISSYASEVAASELGTNYYDATTYEYLSDQFAARHGYGKHLITSLEKISPRNVNFHANMMEIITVLAGIHFGISVATLGIGLALSSPVVLIGGIVVITAMTDLLFFKGYHHRDFTYDELKVRYQRIREQEVAKLKEMELEPQDKKMIVDTIETMDAVIKKMSTYETIFEKITLFFSKKSRDAKNAIELQRELEQLSANDLFVKSAKLSTL